MNDSPPPFLPLYGIHPHTILVTLISISCRGRGHNRARRHDCTTTDRPVAQRLFLYRGAFIGRAANIV